MAKEDFPYINAELPDPVAPLLQKLLSGELLSEEEAALVDTWKNRSEANRALFDRLADSDAVQEMLIAWRRIEQNSEKNKLRGMERIAGVPVRRIPFLRRRMVRYAAAAAVVLGIGIYILTNQLPTDKTLVKNQPPSATDVIAPGRDGAILTLADGSKVVLDSMGNGVVAKQGGTQIVLQDGQLGYTPAGQGEVAFNTISTPKGRQFRLLLPDGTKVWLNAASSLKYPTAFTGNERRVALHGEAYFEVARNADMPFKVDAGVATEVEVLGTSFNINAYDNEPVQRTTLLDGAVRLNAWSQSQVLKPGQQVAVKLVSEKLQLEQEPDLDKATAWKNGLFNFENATLEEVMRQLERWYDIEVTYAKGIPAARFGGEINKQNTLQDILVILEKSNVHFRLEQGRKLVVVP